MPPFFIHLTDLHLRGDSPTGWARLARFVEQVKAMRLRPDFVVNTGDIVSASMRIASAPESVRPDFRRYQRIMADLPVPLYHAVGNHDMTLSDRSPWTSAYGKDLFEEHCGPRYQSFDCGDWHALVLDQWLVGPRLKPGASPIEALDQMADVDEDQLRWIAADLAGCRPGQQVVVFAHHRVAECPRLWAKISDVARR